MNFDPLREREKEREEGYMFFWSMDKMVKGLSSMNTRVTTSLLSLSTLGYVW
jgi:hypothetical protein